jgi:hypothetical protein
MWSCQPEATEREKDLMKTVNGVLDEMKSQMGYKEISPALPVITVADMMDQGWVWGCKFPLLRLSNGRSD